MSGEVLVDALPYIDSGYDEPGVKQAVFALVEEECKRFKPSKNYLEIFGPVNLHQFEVILQFLNFYNINKSKTKILQLELDLLNFYLFFSRFKKLKLKIFILS